jgi:CYTH domain-containing protein
MYHESVQLKCTIKVHHQCTIKVHIQSAQSKCTIKVHHESVPSKCTIKVHKQSAQSKCTIKVHNQSNHQSVQSKCAIEVYIQSVPSKCTIKVYIKSAPSKCTFKVYNQGTVRSFVQLASSWRHQIPAITALFSFGYGMWRQMSMQCFYVWKDIPCVLTSLTQGEQNYDSWGLVAPRMSKTEQKKLVKKTHPQTHATSIRHTRTCNAPVHRCPC